MKKMEVRAKLIMGKILSEVIDRRRRGERPSASEYIQKHPHLREDIEADFHTIEILEGLTPDLPTPEGRLPEAGAGPPVVEVSARQPSHVERPDDPVVLAAFENLSTALSDPRIRPAVISVLQAFADATRRDEKA